MENRISVTISGGIADVKLNRPEKMNALDQAMFDALVATGERLKHEPGLRAVVLSGAGRAFCAGLDMGRFQAMAQADEKHDLREANAERLGKRTHGDANRSQHAVLVWQQIPVPVIAAVHGVALGGGFQVALGADMRFVAPDAKMSILEIKWGLVPDMGGTVLMRRLARADVIRELTFSGRMFSGAEALDYGFATRVSARPYEDAMAYAAEVAGKSPHTIRAAKRLLKLAESADDATLLLAESNEQIAVMGGGNQVEAVAAALQKRAPVFVDP